MLFLCSSLYEARNTETSAQVSHVPNITTNIPLKKFIMIAIVSADIPRNPFENENKLNQYVI